MTRMRPVNRGLIVGGAALIATVVVWLMVGAFEAASHTGDPAYAYAHGDGGPSAVQDMLLFVGAALVLAGVIQHSKDRRK